MGIEGPALLGAEAAQVLAALRIHQNPAHHRLAAQQHPVAHGIAVGERQLHLPALLAEHQPLPDHVAVLRDTAGVAHLPPRYHGGLVAHHHGPVALEGMDLKAHPGAPVALEGNDVGGVEGGGGRTGIDAGLDRRQPGVREAAPLLTAHDDLAVEAVHGSGASGVGRAHEPPCSPVARPLSILQAGVSVPAMVMAEAPYLVALALLEQEGTRALPLNGTSLAVAAAPGLMGRMARQLVNRRARPRGGNRTPDPGGPSPGPPPPAASGHRHRAGPWRR